MISSYAFSVLPVGHSLRGKLAGWKVAAIGKVFLRCYGWLFLPEASSILAPEKWFCFLLGAIWGLFSDAFAVSFRGCDFSLDKLHFLHSGIPRPTGKPPHPQGRKRWKCRRAQQDTVPWRSDMVFDDGKPRRRWYIQFGGGNLRLPPKQRTQKKIKEQNIWMILNDILPWLKNIKSLELLIKVRFESQASSKCLPHERLFLLWKSGTVIIPVVWGPKLTKKGRFWKVTNCLRQTYLIHRFSSESSCLGKKKYSILKWHVDSVNYLLMVQASCTATSNAKPLPHPWISEISTTNLASTMLK